MGFLAPLYIIGGLAIAMPIIFHLIRRQPRGRQVFSSLMFLTPSPPRLVRRNRLDNLLLLLLRGIVLTLLAIAFMRPFWRSAVDTDQEAPARKRIVLVDTSASMRREALWQQAQQKIEEVLNDIGPRDSVALYAFDTSVRPLLAIEDVMQMNASERKRSLQMAAAKLSPTWNTTDLGLALMTAADLLHSAAENRVEGESSTDSSSVGEIVLISDLQSGANTQKIESYQWPDDIRVDVRPVRAADASNAHAVLLASSDEVTEDRDNRADLRVRVANSKTSKTDRLTLRWMDESGKSIGEEPLAVQVVPNEIRVLRFAEVPVEATHLQLEGDAHSFDNAVYFAQRDRLHRKLIFIGDEKNLSTEGLAYFLMKLPLENQERDVEVVFRSPGDTSPWPALSEAPLVVAGQEANPADAEPLKAYLESGGNVLWVLDRPLTESIDGPSSESLALRKLTGDERLDITEATGREYAMMQQIKFKHALFAALDNPRYNDFTKIRFWKHRKLEFGSESDWNILARFDDGAPALSERRIGSGTLWLLAAGWQPSDSQLALSSKFVTLIGGMFALSEPPNPWSTTIHVGDKVSLRIPEGLAHLVNSKGTEMLADGDTEHVIVHEPGIYTIASADRSIRMAANIGVEESITEPMDLARLEQLGVATGRALSLQEIRANKRQMQAIELEDRQKWWRWLILGALAFVATETILAARASKASLAPVTGSTA